MCSSIPWLMLLHSYLCHCNTGLTCISFSCQLEISDSHWVPSPLFILHLADLLLLQIHSPIVLRRHQPKFLDHLTPCFPRLKGSDFFHWMRWSWTLEWNVHINPWDWLVQTPRLVTIQLALVSGVNPWLRSIVMTTGSCDDRYSCTIIELPL